MASRFSQFTDWFLRLPHKLWIALVAIMFFVGDHCFPFSDFPMYSNFPDATFYVYVADGDGNALPLFDIFGYRTTFLKRAYHTNVKDLLKGMNDSGEDADFDQLTVEQLRPAGDATLKWLVESRRHNSRKFNVPAALRLEEVDITLRDGRFIRETRTVGRWPGGQP